MHNFDIYWMTTSKRDQMYDYFKQYISQHHVWAMGFIDILIWYLL